MQVVVVGVHQRTAPVAIRETLAFAPDAIAPALSVLSGFASEAFILSTCNRVEIYAAVPHGDGGRSLRRFLAQQHGLAEEELAPYLYTFINEDAVRHLFRVASGLDSMALGEDQIMVQVKNGLHHAHEAGMLSGLFNRLLRMALATGKLVRTDTNLGRAQLSVVSVALHLARQNLHHFSGRRVVVLGAGRTAELALKHLRSEPLDDLVVLNRTPQRAMDLAQRFGGRGAGIDCLDAVLGEADLVITCTSSPEPLITKTHAERLFAQRGEVVILDLAVPRDVERRVGALPNVTLYDVDDLQAVCDANRTSRAAEVSGAEEIVNGQVEKYMHWWASQEVLPTIRALRDHAETIRQAELDRALSRLPGLSAQQQQAVAALTSAIVNKLLHLPITSLKQPEASDVLAQATQQLFQLQPVRTSNGDS